MKHKKYHGYGAGDRATAFGDGRRVFHDKTPRISLVRGEIDVNAARDAKPSITSVVASSWQVPLCRFFSMVGCVSILIRYVWASSGIHPDPHNSSLKVR